MSRTIRLLPSYALGFFNRASSGNQLAPAGTVATVSTGGAQTAPSPTGRNPTYLWSGEKQYVWNQMRANNHWYWAYVKYWADREGTASPPNTQMGNFSTWVYQTTGDLTYAAKAWAILSASLAVQRDNLDANGVREQFTFYVILVDWLWPSLNATDRQNAITWLGNWADYTLASGTPQYVGGFNTADTDALHGYLGGLYLLNYFPVAENTLYGTLLSRTDRNTGLAVGGPYATGTSGNLRNAAEWYQRNIIPGGVWMESSEYNAGTSHLAMTLSEGTADVVTASGHPFPYLKSYIADYCRLAWYEITPDWQTYIQWGDEQNARDNVTSNYAYRRFTAVASAAGIVATSDPTAAALANAVAQEMYTRSPNILGGSGSSFNRRSWLFWNPYATTATLPTGQHSWFASGMNQQFVKDDSSLFWSFSPPASGQHHRVGYGQTFQLYRNGEFCVRTPIGYDTVTRDDNVSQNSVVLAGLQRHMSSRDLVRQEEGADWWCTTSTTSGGYYDAGYYQPPPAFVNSLERRVVYFKENGFDVIVVKDAIDAVDPRTLSNFTRYRTSNPNDQALINAQEAVKVFLLHTPTLPSWSGNVATWTTSGGQTCKQHVLLPSGITTSVVNESTTGAISSASGISANEKKYHTKFYESPENQVTTALQVIICGNGTQPTISGASVSGVTVGTRTVTFNASSTTVS